METDIPLSGGGGGDHRRSLALGWICASRGD